MSNFSVLGVPVLKGFINPTSFDKQQIIKDIEYNYNIDPYLNEWDGKDKNSSTLHHNYLNKSVKNDKFKTINYSSLKPIYHQAIKDFLNNLDLKQKELKYNFLIGNYTCSKELQQMKTHDHISHCDFVLIHYIQFDKNTHKPTMYNNTHMFGNYIADLRPKLKSILNNTINNVWINKEFYIDVKEDEFVIVPAALPHFVPSITKTDKCRITIAANIELG